MKFSVGGLSNYASPFGGGGPEGVGEGSAITRFLFLPIGIKDSSCATLRSKLHKRPHRR